MKVRITVEREYEMDEAKVIAEFGSYMEERGQSLEDFLRESDFAFPAQVPAEKETR